MTNQNASDSTVAADARSSMNKPHPSEYLEFVTTYPEQCARLEPIKVAPESDKEDVGNRINVTVSNDDLFHGLSAAIPGLRRLSVEARAATKAEHEMTFARGCRLYPKAMLW